MSHRLNISSTALRAIAALPKREQRRAKLRIDALADNPRPHGYVKLSGHANLYRIRFGDYRIIYSIHDDVLVVLVIHVAHRRESYRDL
jgi:mRNA interferase RelE/StbE